MKLELFYPVKPYIVNQPWGVKNDFYKQFGFSQHNGVDIRNFGKVYAELDCEYYRSVWQPNGGGLTLGVLSTNTYDFPDGQYRILIDYLHLSSIILPVGKKAKVGELIAIPGNTGVTTGPHCHIQYRRVMVNGAKVEEVDKNDAHNSFDPDDPIKGYRNGWYAVDYRESYDKTNLLIKLLKSMGLWKDA